MASRVLNAAVASLDNSSTDPAAIRLIKGGLAEDLLWYDGVTIVSSSFWEVKHLLRWFGADALREMCQRGELHFLRIPNTLGYVSASGARNIGLKSEPGVIALRSGGDFEGRNNPHPADWREQMERVVHEAMPWGHKRSALFVQQLEEGVTDFSDTASHFREVILATRRDMDRPELRSLVADDPAIDPTDLPEGHAGRQAILQIASANHFLLLLADAEATHLRAGPIAGEVLHSKLERVLPPELRSSGLTQLLALKDLPSISAAINLGQITFKDVAEMRRTRNAQRFREWLQANVGGENQGEAVKAYLAALEQAGKTALPTKIARFVLSSTAAVGLELIVSSMAGVGAGVGAGVALGAFDAFLVDRLMDGWTPGMFLDEELGARLAPRRN